MSEEKTTVDNIIDASIDVERALDKLKDTLRDRKFREAVEILTEAQQSEILAGMSELASLMEARNSEYEALLENWGAYNTEKEKRLKAEADAAVPAPVASEPAPVADAS